MIAFDSELRWVTKMDHLAYFDKEIIVPHNLV